MKTIVLLAAIALASCASDSHYVSHGGGPRVAPAPVDPSPAPPRPGDSGYPLPGGSPGFVGVIPRDRTFFVDRTRWIPSPAPREEAGHGRIDPPRPICPEGPILGEPPRAPSPGSRFADPSIARRVDLGSRTRTVIPRAPETTPAPGMRRIDVIPRPSGALATTAGRRVDLAPSTRIGSVIPSR